MRLGSITLRGSDSDRWSFTNDCFGVLPFGTGIGQEFPRLWWSGSISRKPAFRKLTIPWKGLSTGLSGKMHLPQPELYFELGVDVASLAPYAFPVFGGDFALVVEDFEPARPEFAEMGEESLVRLSLLVTPSCPPHEPRNLQTTSGTPRVVLTTWPPFQSRP